MVRTFRLLHNMINISDTNHKSVPFSWRSRLRSFVFAFRGITALLRREHNARLHLATAFIAVCLGWMLKLSAKEWLMIVISVAAVFTMELLNSAIEELVDLLHPEYHPAAGRIKDYAAAAVLITAAGAFICGMIIFLPKIFSI